MSTQPNRSAAIVTAVALLFGIGTGLTRAQPSEHHRCTSHPPRASAVAAATAAERYAALKQQQIERPEYCRRIDFSTISDPSERYWQFKLWQADFYDVH